MSNTLRQLLDNSHEVISELVENGGELTPDLEQRLSGVDLAVREKIEGYASIIERLNIEAKYFKEKADSFSRIARGCDRSREFLRTNIESAMRQLGVDQIEGTDSRFALVKSTPSVIIDNLTEVPAEFKKEVVEISADKVSIKKAIQLGNQVPGAHLEEGYQLRSYVNRRMTERS